MPRGNDSVSIMSIPAVAACKQLEPRRLGKIGPPDMADDDLGLGQCRDHPLRVVEVGEDDRVIEPLAHLGQDARRDARGQAAEEQGFHGSGPQFVVTRLIRLSPRAKRRMFSATSSQRRRTMPLVQPELCGVTMTFGSS